jgi:hypothetical protein
LHVVLVVVDRAVAEYLEEELAGCRRRYPGLADQPISEPPIFEASGLPDRSTT